MMSLILGLMLTVPAGTAAQERSRNEEGVWTSPAGLKHRLYAPKSPKDRPGLVMLLHGDKEGPEALETEFKDACVKAGFVVAAPFSPALENPDATNKAWGRADTSKLVALTRELALAYRVDRTRIYVIGMSPRNPGGDLLFMRRSLYSGFVSVGGTSRGYLRPLTPKEKQEFGVYFIVGADDRNKKDTVRMRDQVKREGLLDVVYKEIEGVGHEVPPGCSGEVVKWLAQDRRKYLTGVCPDIPWVSGKSLFPRLNMHYFHSDDPKFAEACRAVEWDWFGDPGMITRAQKMDCLRFVLESSTDHAKTLGVREPSIVFLDPETSKVKFKITARQVLALRKSSLRTKDAFEGYGKFMEGLNKKLEAALK